MSKTADINVNVNTVEAENSLNNLGSTLESSKGTFDAFKDSADLLAGSVSTVVGGLAVLGVENEWIENLEQGAVGAIGFAQGVSQTGGALVNLSKNARIAAVAQRAFNLVLQANPYVLIATTIIAVGAAIFGLTRETEDNTEAVADNTKERERQEKALKDQEKATDDLRRAQERLADASGRTRQEKLAEELEATNKRISQLSSSVSALEAQEFGLSEEFKNRLKLQRTELQTLVTTRKAIETEITNIVEKEQEKQEQIESAANEKRNNERKSQNEKEKEEEKRKQEEITAKIIEENARRAEEQAEFLSEIEALENEFTDSQLTKQQQEENAVRDKYFAIIEAAREAGLETLTLEAALQAELQTIRDEAAAEQAEKDAAQAEKDAEKRQQDIDNELAVQQAKFDIVAGTFTAISDLTTAFAGENEQAAKRAFNVNKAASIAEATISTYAAATNVLATAAANPATILFPGYPALQAGLIIAQGLANVRQILRQKFTTGGGAQPASGGGGGGAGAAGGVATGVPAISGPPEGFERQAELFGAQNQQPIQAYVVAGDVQNGLEAQNQIDARRTL